MEALITKVYYKLQMMEISGSDFWWLTSDKVKFRYVRLGHHEPIRDNDQRSSIKWYRETCLVSNISQWRDRFQNANIYRSLKVLSTKSGEQEILGPFIIDIDSECENLQDAFDITRKVVSYLVQDRNLKNDDIRIFFSGRKGFNIEVSPAALGIQGSIQDQIKQSSSKLDEIIGYLRGSNIWQTANQVSNKQTIIDRIYGDRFRYELKHPCLRLHGSLNKWIASNGTRCQRKIQLNIHHLNRMNIKDIWARSKNREE